VGKSASSMEQMAAVSNDARPIITTDSHMAH
jgi:hypothetical protein